MSPSTHSIKVLHEVRKLAPQNRREFSVRCNSLVLRGFGISAKSRALIQVFVGLMPELSRDVLMLCQEAKSTHYNVIRVTLFGWIKCVKCQRNVCTCKSYINAMLAWWYIIASVLVIVALTFWFETNLDAFSIGNWEEKEWDWQFKGIVQPKMRTLSSFTQSRVILNL